ncbi:proteoglycan 4 isoform X2 [Nilaparvata lugens]|uniref:proteoglycan 4 isoform X2 n=1 Tax=Nilaparvata lugens TaxID=108931 RepID=UPI00193D1AA2|nr:proteoglycan 4 isoform X2 [Nilaparvata lugens]
MGGFAWVTLATNDSYSLGALVLAHSLKRVNTAHQLAILITPGVTEAMRTQLSAVFNVVKEVDVLDSKDTANLALLARPELGITFTKLHCWRLTQYDKCVFLDADTLVLQNCDELFEREELSAAPDVGWPDCFNSGVFVYKPSDETFKAISDFALVHGTFDGGDQGLLNLYFSDWATKDIARHLPFVYNVVSCVSYSYLPAFKQFRDKLKIIHFIGATKPWLQPFDTEKGLSRVSSEPLAQSQSDFIQLWWSIFCTSVHPSLSANMSHHRLSYLLPSRASTPSTNFFSTSDPSSFSPSSSLLYNQTSLPDRSLPPPYDTNTNTNANTGTGHYYFTDPWEVGNEDAGHNTQNFSHNSQHFTGGENSDNLQHFTGHSGENVHHYHNSQHFTGHSGENVHHYQPEHKQIYREDRRQEHHASNTYWQQNHHHHQHHDNHQNHDNHHQNHDHHHQQHQNDDCLQMSCSQVDSFSRETTCHEQASSNFSLHKQDSNSLSSPSHHTKLHPSHSPSPSHHSPYSLPPPPSSSELKESEESAAQANAGENEEAGLAGALATVKLGSPLSEEQHALQDHLRRQGWEEGHMDYMGRDSFDNIWAKICQTLSTGPSPVPASADLPAPPADASAAKPQASAPTRVEARRTSVPKAEKALETLFMKPNTMLQPTSEQADPLTPPPFLTQPQFAPTAAPVESKTDDAKLAESTACPLPPKPASESPACPIPPKPQPESPVCPIPPKPESESPACPIPTKPQSESPVCPIPPKPASESPACPIPPKPEPESPSCPIPPKAQPESPACPIPPKPEPESSACPIPPKPEPESPACPIPPKPEPESPACPIPPKPAAESPVCPIPPKPQPESPACPIPPKPQPESPACPLPPKPEDPVCPIPPKSESAAPTQPAEVAACPLPKPATEAAPEPLACPIKKPDAPAAEQACQKPVAPQVPVPAEAPAQTPASVETPVPAVEATVPAAVPVPAQTPAPVETPVPAAVPVPAEAPVPAAKLPETPPQSPQQETPVQPATPVQPQPEAPKTPVQSQPSTPTVTTATPPLSPPPVPSESPVSATEKLSVQPDIPQTPPVVDAPPAVPQASSAPTDEPPIPPKRKGGRGGGGDQGKQGRGGKGGRGKK